MKRTVLLIDDDLDLAQITADLLETYGYEVKIAGACNQAFQLLTKEMIHLILLDINLPDGSGYEICKELRKNSQIPIIFASARSDEIDKIKGLDMGGDDYLVKPYSLKELLSRVNALMRRVYRENAEAEIYSFSEYEIDLNLRSVSHRGKEVKLSLKEFDVLAYFCTHQNQVVKKEDLLRAVWGVFSEVEIATVAVHIRWLREKLEDDPSHPVLIQTVWGIGYQLVVD